MKTLIVDHDQLGGPVKRQLRREKTALVVDSNGQTQAYLVDAEAYDGMQARLRMLEGIARGEKAIRQGRVFTQAQAKKRMARWLRKN